MNTMLQDFELESNDFLVVDDPTWQLFGEAATVWTSLKERASVEEKNVVSDDNILSSADMKEILTNTQDRVSMTMASCTKAYKHAVGFGSDRMLTIKAA